MRKFPEKQPQMFRRSVPQHDIAWGRRFGTVHTFQNFLDQEAHMLVMVTPAGLDRIFEDLTAQNKGLSQQDLAKAEQLMQSYGIEMLGPPLS